MSLRRTLVRNLTSGWIEQALSVLLRLFLTPILIGHFGTFEYGLWITIGQVAALLFLLDAGVANSVARFIARAKAVDDFDELERVYSTSLALFLLSASLVVLFLLATVAFVPGWFSVPDEYWMTTVWLYLLAGFNICLVIPLRVGRGLLQAVDRYDRISLITVVTEIIRFVLFIYFFKFSDGGLLLLAWLTFATGIISELVIYRSALRDFPGLRFSFAKVTRASIRSVFSLGTSSLLQTLSAMLFTKAFGIAIAALLGIAIVPLYSIPSALVTSLGPFISRIGATMTPIASRMDAQGDRDKLRSLCLSVTRFGTAFGIPAAIGVVLFGRQFFALWLGHTDLTSSDLESIWQCSVIMVWVLALARPQMVSRSVLRATGRHWAAAWTMFLSASVSVCVGIVLMQFTSLGVLAAALGWSVHIAISELISMPLLLCRHLDIPPRQFVTDTIGTPLLAGVLQAAIGYGLVQLIPIGNWTAFVVVGGLFGVCSLAAAFAIVLSRDDRRYVLSLSQQLRTHRVSA